MRLRKQDDNRHVPSRLLTRSMHIAPTGSLARALISRCDRKPDEYIPARSLMISPPYDTAIEPTAPPWPLPITQSRSSLIPLDDHLSPFVSGGQAMSPTLQSVVLPLAPTLRRKWYGSLRGQYRIFNAATYRFYRSNSGPPAETDTPFATNATLPHEPTDTYANGTWYLSMSYYNGVIDSGFLPLGPNGETYMRLDIASGAVVGNPPQPPLVWNVTAAVTGKVRVQAVYMETGALRATQWAIAVGQNNPPAIDTPSWTPLIATTGQAVLDHVTTSGWPEFSELFVRCQTRRSDDGGSTWIYSDVDETKTIISDALADLVPTSGDKWRGRTP